MFEITADDIALLNDADLRSLVGRLCESEARRRGLPTSSVTWGGDQNAADGGIDVRVAFQSGSAIEGFIPKPATGFQVKTSDMSRGEVLAEMRPSGVLRAAIQELANEFGAYIIVSSTGSTSDTALKARRNSCIRCGACVVQCPTDALAFEDDHGRRIEPDVIRRFKLNLLGERSVDTGAPAPGDDTAHRA